MKSKWVKKFKGCGRKQAVRLMSAAFTLTELLLAISILALMGVLAIPKFYPQNEKARISEAIAMLNTIRQAEKIYFISNSSYRAINLDTGTTSDWNTIELDNPNSSPSASPMWNYGVVQDDPNLGDWSVKAKRMNTANNDYKNKCIALNIVTGSYGNVNGCTKHPYSP